MPEPDQLIVEQRTGQLRRLRVQLEVEQYRDSVPRHHQTTLSWNSSVDTRRRDEGLSRCCLEYSYLILDGFVVEIHSTVVAVAAVVSGFSLELHQSSIFQHIDFLIDDPDNATVQFPSQKVSTNRWQIQ